MLEPMPPTRALALLSLALLEACSSESGPVDAGRECGSAADCDGGAICIAGRCVAAPEVDACVGACACTTAADCTVSACSDVACVSGSCVVEPDDGRCGPEEQCDATRGCVLRADGGTADGGAADGGAADDAGAPDASALGGLGAPCAAAADCDLGDGGDAVCATRVRMSDVRFPGGYCSRACADDAACPEGAVCWQASTIDGFCVAPCGPLDARCRPDYSCGTPATGTLDDATPICHPSGS